MLKQLFPKIDENLFKQLFDFEWQSLSSALKGVWSNRYRQKLYYGYSCFPEAYFKDISDRDRCYMPKPGTGKRSSQETDRISA